MSTEEAIDPARERGLRRSGGHPWHGLPPLERFWLHVEKSDGCWRWLGGKNKQGYGSLRVGQKTVRAHRFSCESFIGAIPDGHCVMHVCDNPSCVRPSHLTTGTPRDNMRDCVAKGRFSRPAGEDGPMAKLTWAQALEIRAARARGELLADLAKEYGVSKHTISLIGLGRTWKTPPKEYTDAS